MILSHWTECTAHHLDGLCFVGGTLFCLQLLHSEGGSLLLRCSGRGLPVSCVVSAHHSLHPRLLQQLQREDKHTR